MRTQISTHALKSLQDIESTEEITIDASFSDFDEFLLHFIDIKEGGLIIRAIQALPLGIKVKLYCTLQSTGVTILESYAEVISIEKDDPKTIWGMTVKLIDFPEEKKILVSRLIKNFL